MPQLLTFAKPLLLTGTLLAITIGSSSCVTKRTTTEGGRVVNEKYVVKRPVKNLLNNIEVE